ncbi:MAG: DUF982 domain-containing protein [Phyllobacterium sp.]|uniref:DUF982 domain-containing protein n=1 Tax=Phyllobacterium sp. TaxID=1871046 RepID=UPI0030F16E73
MEENAFRPLILRRQGKKPETIGTLNDAFEFLKHNWHKARRGPVCQRAKIACSAALKGAVTVEEARSAFIEAAVEANMLVEDVADSLIQTLVAKALPGNFE